MTAAKMARTFFSLQEKHRPVLSVPDEKELHHHFGVSYEGHFDTIKLSLAAYSLPQAPGKRYYACSARISSCCDQPIPEKKLENYVSSLLDSTLLPQNKKPKSGIVYRRWVIDKYVRNARLYSKLMVADGPERRSWRSMACLAKKGLFLNWKACAASETGLHQ